MNSSQILIDSLLLKIDWNLLFMRPTILRVCDKSTNHSSLYWALRLLLFSRLIIVWKRQPNSKESTVQVRVDLELVHQHQNSFRETWTIFVKATQYSGEMLLWGCQIAFLGITREEALRWNKLVFRARKQNIPAQHPFLDPSGRTLWGRSYENYPIQYLSESRLNHRKFQQTNRSFSEL